MFLAVMETENFSWLAAGETEAEARTALRRGWRAHMKEYGSTGEGLSDREIEAAYEPNIVEIQAGDCVRDHDTITTTNKKED